MELAGILSEKEGGALMKTIKEGRERSIKRRERLFREWTK